MNVDGQTCISNPSVNQGGDVELTINIGRQVIIPRAVFSCYGRITNITVSMWSLRWPGDQLPLFQVWRPTSLTSNTYNKTAEIQLPAGRYIWGTNYYFARLSLSNSDQIEFQSGDVIGYYQPSNPWRGIWSIETNGYISYSNYSLPLTSIDISNVDIVNSS